MLMYFPPFHADLVDERLWNGAKAVRLTPKAWGVLRVLLEANGRLVTKDQLAETVWPGTHVADDSLTKVVRELRRALAACS
jgi:DNA-binding winged helix-turn-helix (wHTH) protein